MRRLLSICILSVSLTQGLSASEFDWLVREFSRQSGAEQTHIPLFGLVRFCVWAARPAGTRDLRLAIFEHANLQPERFSQLADDVTGIRWKPIVRVRSRQRESTNIYVQENGKDLELLIATFEAQEATFVQVRLRPQQLIHFVDENRHSKHKDM
jgi:predicted metal-binding transcription factor (methanogenesis marker protein 9)